MFLPEIYIFHCFIIIMLFIISLSLTHTVFFSVTERTVNKKMEEDPENTVALLLNLKI